jgi:hypothetical protein
MMHAKDTIRQTLDMGDMVLQRYVGDLDDADLKVHPAEGMNPIAWQIGHLISVERSAIEGIKPGSSPKLPEGFDDAHSTESAKANNLSGLKTKADYLDLWQAQHAATKAVLDGLSDAELDAPAPERFQRMCPTVGAVMVLMGTHALMHVGQFVPVRRKSGKPVVI